MKNNSCGTCIGGEQMAFGCYHRCMSCKGTGICNHVFEGGEIEYTGEQWHISGTKKVPEYKLRWCTNCGAHEKTWLDNKGKARYSPTITSNNW